MPDADFWKLFEKLRRPVGLFLLLVLTSVLQHIFDMHFVCSCQPGLHTNGVLYIALPPLILALAVNFAKIFFKKTFFFTVDCSKWYLCVLWPVLKFVFQYIGLIALWSALVLFDGDWYFCLKTNINPDQTGMPCKTNLTYEEERIRDSYKTESLDFGFYLCCGLLFVWSIIKKIRRHFRSCCYCCTRPYFEAKYNKILSEEISIYIEKNLKTFAENQAKEMCEPKIEVLKENNMNEASQTWKNLSNPKFIWKYQEEKNTENNDTNSTQRESTQTGRSENGQEGLNMGTAQDFCGGDGGSGQGESANLNEFDCLPL